MVKFLNAALQLAAQGYRVFALKPYGKRPIVENWPERATRDPLQIREWWTRVPYANIGILTGSDLYVVDLDRKHGPNGPVNYQRLCKELGIDPRTRWARTANNGFHLYYSLPEGVELRNTAGKLAPGVDGRGQGGYVVAPPSRLHSGIYQWGGIKDISPLPESLLERLQPHNPAPSAEQGHTPDITHPLKYVESVLARAGRRDSLPAPAP